MTARTTHAQPEGSTASAGHSSTISFKSCSRKLMENVCHGERQRCTSLDILRHLAVGMLCRLFECLARIFHLLTVKYSNALLKCLEPMARSTKSSCRVTGRFPRMRLAGACEELGASGAPSPSESKSRTWPWSSCAMGVLHRSSQTEVRKSANAKEGPGRPACVADPAPSPIHAFLCLPFAGPEHQTGGLQACCRPRVA